MNRIALASIAAGLALTAACTQQTAQQLNTANANSQVYIGALTCNVTGSTGYVFGSSRDLSCVYLTKEGLSQAYDGKIRRFGLDLGTTKPSHVIWKVYQLGGLVGDSTSANPKVIAGRREADRPRGQVHQPERPGHAAGPRDGGCQLIIATHVPLPR